jgi:cysteine-rich repeat protein
MLPYYLNLSSQACIACQESQGLSMQADGCHEVCGDGKIINHACDDGNTNSGDGCSGSCQIEDGFECKQISGVSRCWGRGITVDWQTFAIFGNNSFILSLISQFPLSSATMDVQCGFKNTLGQRVTVGGR